MDKSGNPSLSIKTRLDRTGRLVVPAAIREQLGLKPGETLFLDVEDGVLKVEGFATRLRKIQDEFSKYATPGVLASEELIAERREEARREEKEYQSSIRLSQPGEEGKVA